MRIEINFGGLSGASVSDFCSDFDKLVNKAEDVISAFQSINKITHNINGGVGNLQGAVDSISARIRTEEQRKSDLEKVRTKADNFIELVKRIDKEVSDKVNQNTEEFYQVNPWAQPPGYGKNPLEKAWDWLCEKGEAIIEGVQKFKEKAGQWAREFVDTIAKTWTAVKRWCSEHSKAIIKLAVTAGIILALAGLTAFCPVLAPITAGMLKGALIGAAALGMIGGSVSAIGEAMKGNATAGSIFGAFFDGMAEGALEGAIGGAIGGAFSTLKFAGAVKHVVEGFGNGIGNAMATATNYFIENGSLKGSGGKILKDFTIGFVIGSTLSIGKEAMSNSISKISSVIKSKVNINPNGIAQKWLSSSEDVAGKVAKESYKIKDIISDSFKPVDFDKEILNKGAEKAGSVVIDGVWSNILSAFNISHDSRGGGGGGGRLMPSGAAIGIGGQAVLNNLNIFSPHGGGGGRVGGR